MIEIEMDENAMLISETDTEGKITFANDDFLLYNGYGWEELCGKSHSILRHPDMPETTYKELWETIRAGQAWCGMVKNKTRSGDFYWAFATITPIIFENGETRYLSMRTKPSSEEIDRHESLCKNRHFYVNKHNRSIATRLPHC